jgi:hypothetical protein
VLRPELLAQLRQRLADPLPDGGLWTGPKVARWMAGELGLKAVAPQPGWEALKAIGWTLPDAPAVSSRRGHARGARGVQQKLKQAVAQESAKQPDKPIEGFATDEHRIGVKPIPRRVWAAQGQRPIALSPRRYKWLYCDGRCAAGLRRGVLVSVERRVEALL